MTAVSRMRPVWLALLVLASACGGRGEGTVGPGAADGGAVPAARVEGTVRARVPCPDVLTDGPCPPRPVSVRIEVRPPSGGPVASVRSGADGRFSVALPPGAYLVDVRGPRWLSLPGPVRVDLRAGQTVTVGLLLRPSIRMPPVGP